MTHRSSGPVRLAARGLLAALWLLAAGLLLGCEEKKEPAPAPAPPVPAAPAPAEAPQAGPAPSAPASGQLVWKAPQGWTEMPQRPMRKATYEVSGAAGPAEVSVFYFGPGGGGGVEANLQRWVGQFRDLPSDAAERSKQKIGTFEVHLVRVKSGTFSSGMPGQPQTPKEGWGMNAAVVETPLGLHFFKMVGPKQTVDASEGDFTSLLESLKVES